jgi:hypothetical protein
VLAGTVSVAFISYYGPLCIRPGWGGDFQMYCAGIARLYRDIATAASNILQLPVYDTQYGAKLFRNGPLAREVFGGPFDSNWAFDVEVFARYAQAARRDDRSPARHGSRVPAPGWRDVSGAN